jgi:hypothetical protein
VRARTASTVPVQIRELNSCSHSSTTSRRLIRLRTDNVTTAACSLGPNAVAATSAGSRPVRLAPQPRQRTLWHRCSVTRTAITGSSST